MRVNQGTAKNDIILNFVEITLIARNFHRRIGFKKNK